MNYQGAIKCVDYCTDFEIRKMKNNFELPPIVSGSV